MATQSPTAPRALSIKQFCETYSVGRTLANELMTAGAFEVRRVGRHVLIDAITAEAWYIGLPRLPKRCQRHDRMAAAA